MQLHEKRDFGQLIKDVMAYYRQDTSRFILDLWWKACENFEFEQIQVAIQRHVSDPEHGVYPPKVADIARVLQGTSGERAALAWGKVSDAMSRIGAYQDVVFDDPAIHAVIEDMGGWPKLCRTDLKELGYVQHRFGEAHRAYTNRGQFDYPRRLGGDRSPDSEYASKGLKLPAPAVVGDREKALQVYRLGGLAAKTSITFQPLQALGNEIAALITAPQEVA